MSKVLGLGVPDPLETYRTSPHLFTDLVISEGTTGRLPRAKRTRAGLDAEVLEDLGGSAPRSEGRGGMIGLLAGRRRLRSPLRGARPWQPFGLAWRSRAFRTQRRFQSFLARIAVARVPGWGSHAERG